MTDDLLQRLLDLEEIKQLKARYFRCMDTKDWDGYGEVFTRDCRMVVPEADLVLEGRASIVQSISTILDGVRSVHHGHMPEIQIENANEASGIWAMFDYVDFGSTDGRRVGVVGYGHYFEKYRREEGVWRISETRLERLRRDPLE
jgi:hypothetical protein